MSRLSQPFIILLLLGSLVTFSACSHGPGPSTTYSSSSTPKVQTAQRAVRGSDTLATVQAKPEWFTCKTDQDCMAVEGICNSKNAINRLFRGPFVEYRNAMNRQISCKATPTVSNTGVQVGCIKNRCVVNPQKLKQPGAPSTRWPADNPNLHSY